MSETREKHIGEAPLGENARKKLLFLLKEGSVGTEHLKDGSVTASKLATGIVDSLVDPLYEKIFEKVDSTFVADSFGNSTERTVSQKLLTDTVNDLYAKIREISGEPPVGLYLTATPEYFIGEEGADIHIEAISTNGIFEKVAFWVDEVFINEAESVYRLEADTHIDKSSVIRCRAQVLGMDYEVTREITHYNSFWLGAGSSYQDIMDTAHIVPFENRLRGAYNVTCQEGDRIIIIVGEHLREGFIRADLNGFEIPFASKVVTLGGNTYWVMTSENRYVAGTYNIDING